MKKITRKDQLSLVVTDDDFKDADGNLQELHAVKKHFSIQQEGDPDLFFDVPQERQEETTDTPLPDAVDDELRGENHGGLSDLVVALSGVVDVDDDNQPAPENIPTTTNTPSLLSSKWGHEGVCFRKESNCPNSPAVLVRPVDTTRDDVNLQLFERLFPKNFLQEVMIPTMNRKLSNPVSYGELLSWIGWWVLMSMVDGSDRQSFWSSKEVNIYEGAPFRLMKFMSQNRFEEILGVISYMDKSAPELLDKFWEVRDLIAAWNASMEVEFLPSWINAIDESMLKWLNEYTCPGFMYIPRKPWKFGNEWHDAGCCSSDVIWSVNLREGKDCPRHLGEKEYGGMGKTVGTLLRLMKSQFGTGKTVVLDSGFCVLQGLVELKKNGIYAHAVIKKRRYWPKHVPGDAIIEHFNNKQVGETDAIRGELDGVPFYLYGMKEPDYIMQIMSTYGTLHEKGLEKKALYLEWRKGCEDFLLSRNCLQPLRLQRHD